METTKITSAQGAERQRTKAEQFEAQFTQAVEFVREQVLAKIPTASMEDTEAIVSIHAKDWRPVYDHIISVH